MNNEKVIIITGSEGEIGSTAVKRFTQEGWQVIGIDIVNEESVKNEYCKYINADVTNRALLIEKINEIEGVGTEITALLTATAKKLNASFQQTDIEDWKKLLRTYLAGAINACAAVAPHMVARKFGKIVLLTPDYKYINEDCILNATAAGTLHGFSKCFGVEMAPNNVMVNALYPNLPIDLEKTADVVFYLADKDEYTTAQVISITGAQ